MPDYKIYRLGEFALESGGNLPDARLAYQTYGKLNSENDNAILLCSFITGTHEGYQFVVGEKRCLDPERYFIIATNLFGNGLSSSPSNTAPPFDGPRFPRITIRDNVRAQRLLLQNELGIRRLALVAGFSMGAQQAYQWAVSYPDVVERIAAWCGHARTTPYTHVFLDGLGSVLKAASDWNDGDYKAPPVIGLRALARAYAGWGTSAAWYRAQLWKELGFATLEEFMVGFWERFFVGLEANDFMAQVETWKLHNVGGTKRFDGNHHKALASIRARTLVMPCTTDTYFRAEDAQEEVADIPNATFKAIPSVWGHWAGFGVSDSDRLFLNDAISQLLEKG
jgi:homoserine O-acetyltransferase/O-succinyltransferase